MQILVELPYWPPVSWLVLAWRSDTLWLEACENFQKSSYRNRCQIAGPNGIQRLSIPLLSGKHQKGPIRDVKIAYDEPWQDQHWKSIATAYGNAPYFDYMVDHVRPFYQKHFTYLFDLNIELLQFIKNWLPVPATFKLTESYQTQIDPSVTDLRNTIRPKATTLPYWFEPKSYPQVFLERHGFLPDLSALDLLFCCGKQSGLILQQSLSHSAF